jgi:uncharacterized protein YkwD
MVWYFNVVTVAPAAPPVDTPAADIIPPVDISPVDTPSVTLSRPTARPQIVTPSPWPTQIKIPTPPAVVTPRAKAAVTPPVKTAIAAATPAPLRHTLKADETLWDIAAEYGVSVEEITTLNQIDDPTTLQIGQSLVIPVTATPSPSPTPRPTRQTTPKPIASLTFHIIEAGDTLLEIALAHDTSVEALLTVNPMLNPTNLQIGQKLLIPPSDGSLPDPITWAPIAEHEVESGDTLLDIAFTYGSSVEDILEANPELDPTLLQIGQSINIPLTQARPQAAAESAAAKNRPPAPALTEADFLALKNGSPSLVGLEEAMVQAVNAQRAAYDLPPYAVDPALTRMAWGQAHDMVKRDYFGHVTPEGYTLRDRFRAEGLPVNWVGENIYLSVLPASQAVDATVSWFMGDAPHRRNLLHENFNRLGVGVAQGESGWYTFVLVFAGD